MFTIVIWYSDNTSVEVRRETQEQVDRLVALELEYYPDSLIEIQGPVA
jgi:hypothetical protein